MFLAGGTDDSRANALNMYNTGQIGSGGAPVGSTSTIVEQESNPELQEARLQNLTEQQQLLLQQQQQVEAQAVQEEAENEIINEQKLLQANAEQQNTLNTAEQATSAGVKLGAELLAPNVVEANKLKNANVYSQLGSDIMKGFKSMKPVTQYAQLPGTVSGSMNSAGFATTAIPGQTVAAGRMAGTGFKAGLGQIGQGIGRFAKTGAGIGTIASLAGAGIKRLSDDNDATTLNFGEGAGGVLSSAGQGMALGSMLGPVGTAVGGIGGALWGLGKGLWSRNKARRTERDLEQESNQAQSQSINRFNEDLTSNYGSALSSIRQGELAQKSISGQDLGYNLVAREGGVRKFANGGFPPGLIAGLGRPGMNIMQQFQNPSLAIGSRMGGGVLGNVANNFGRGIVPETPIVNNPNLILGSEGMSSIPMVRRGGGMRMGMPRYGYAV